MQTMYYDFRTGGRSYGHIMFPSAEYGEESFSPAYFAANSEHVTLYSTERGNVMAINKAPGNSMTVFHNVTPAQS